MHPMDLYKNCTHSDEKFERIAWEIMKLSDKISVLSTHVNNLKSKGHDE